MCLFHFLKIKIYDVIFELQNFVINLYQKAHFSLLTDLGLTQYSCTETGNFRDDFMSENEIRIFLHTEIDNCPDDFLSG